MKDIRVKSLTAQILLNLFQCKTNAQNHSRIISSLEIDIARHSQEAGPNLIMDAKINDRERERERQI